MCVCNQTSQWISWMLWTLVKIWMDMFEQMNFIMRRVYAIIIISMKLCSIFLYSARLLKILNISKSISLVLILTKWTSYFDFQHRKYETCKIIRSFDKKLSSLSFVFSCSINSSGKKNRCAFVNKFDFVNTAENKKNSQILCSNKEKQSNVINKKKK